MSDKITIQCMDRNTGQPDKAGSVFRLMYCDLGDRRHTNFCDGVDELLKAVKTIIDNRAKTCKKLPHDMSSAMKK